MSDASALSSALEEVLEVGTNGEAHLEVYENYPGSWVLALRLDVVSYSDEDSAVIAAMRVRSHLEQLGVTKVEITPEP